mmetsp:Transcript_40566/g.41249  ORF Transcript_40566/g.41249 Transcript_40566/m.41249 type:complete len:132 (-) Transcript_40566:26-421(-)
MIKMKMMPAMKVMIFFSQIQENFDEANDTINTKNQLELMLRESLRETLGMLKPLQQHITFTEQNIRGLKRRLGSAQLLTYETDDKLKQVTEELNVDLQKSHDYWAAYLSCPKRIRRSNDKKPTSEHSRCNS